MRRLQEYYVSLHGPFKFPIHKIFAPLFQLDLFYNFLDLVTGDCSSH